MSTKDDNSNHADQMNPNNDAYWESRGFDERPNDWEERLESEDDGAKSGDGNYLAIGPYTSLKLTATISMRCELYT